MRSAERDLVGPWTETFATVFGEDVVLKALESTDEGAPSDLGTINFPDVVRPLYLIGGTGHFNHVPEMADYVRSLGYDWKEGGRFCATPTPETFRWIMESQGIQSGYDPVYRVEDGDTMSIGPWLCLYLDGKIPIHVRAKEHYQSWLESFDPTQREGFSFHVASFLHDLTVHMLNYHLIPRSWIEQTTARIKKAMPERVEAWKEENSSGPLTMTFFFDNDLNQYALQVWCRCRRPQDYEDIFLNPRNIKLLDDALSLRISQTLEGVGDVASGDTDDAEGLKPLKIELA